MPSIRTVANNLARMKKDHKKERAFKGSKPSISTFYNQRSDLHKFEKSSVEIELHGIVGTEEKREGVSGFLRSASPVFGQGGANRFTNKWGRLSYNTIPHHQQVAIPYNTLLPGSRISGALRIISQHNPPLDHN